MGIGTIILLILFVLLAIAWMLLDSKPAFVFALLIALYLIQDSLDKLFPLFK